MIQINGPQFTQWDVGRSVSISNSDATHIHFANQGDSKAVIINIENGVATIPDYLFQTGKTLLAYAVKDGVTLESKSFAVRKRERPEDYVYEDDQRNYIYELIADAEEAVKAANQAAEVAGQAANNATAVAEQVVQNADAATTRANAAATEAEKASANANEAANRAKSFMVIGQAEGENITLDDAIDQFFVGCRIFGKTTQDGTPTPDAPVELVSVSSSHITVEVGWCDEAHCITIATPTGLPGIPVSSGGNYTDANGQQWICDEIDFARGVYVKRIEEVVLDGSQSFLLSSSGAFTLARADALEINKDNQSTMVGIMCDSYEAKVWPAISALAQNGVALAWGKGVAVRDNRFATVSDFKAHLATNPITVQYILATPIETPLDEVDLANYAELHTYRGYTWISNNASAHMEIEYVMDAKKYIDSMIGSSGAAPTKLTNITLPASAWVGSDSLYSQVVSIDGITEYSKVDLLPSVEQLAIFHNKDVAFITENEDGVVTVYAIGDKPTQNYTMQVSITEVAV